MKYKRCCATPWANHSTYWALVSKASANKNLLNVFGTTLERYE